MTTNSTRTRLTGPERRARIIQAAAEVIGERGFDRVSVDDIAAAAGCSKAVLYDHFASKGELAVAAVRATNLALLEHVGAAVARLGEHPRPERFARGIDAFFAFNEQHPTACRTLFRDPSADPEVFEAHKQAKRAATHAVAAMLATGVEEPRDDRALEMFGEMMTSGLAGLALWWQDHPAVARVELVRAAMSFTYLGLERYGSGERLAEFSQGAQ